MRCKMKHLSCFFGLFLLLGVAGCSDDDSGGACGNGVAEGSENEDCDGEDLAGETCQSLGYNPGSLACTSTCEYDISGCGTQIVCGNGVIDTGEVCDATNLDGNDCTTIGLGFQGGNLACDPNDCTFDTSSCTGGGVCGNSTIEGDEECDTFELNNQTCVTRGFAGGILRCHPSTCLFDTTDCYAQGVIPIGGPCLTSDDCNGGICLEEAGAGHWGPAGGYCFEYCDENDNCPGSGADGICLTNGFCLKTCDISNPDCRAGQECIDVGGGYAICAWGYCTDDSQCTVTGDCDTDVNSANEGWCISPVENCTNGVDDDFDGDVDCGDSECTGFCATGEDCGTAGDEDNDGAADCEDAECAYMGICSGAICTPVAGADLTCDTSLTNQSNDAAGSTDVINTALCMDPNEPPGFRRLDDEYGPEYAYTLTVPQPRLVTVTVENFTCDLDVYIIKDLGGICDAGQGCFAGSYNPQGQDETATFVAYPGVNYYVVVDGWTGQICTYDISVTCETDGWENCNNGQDDDQDGLTDCEDTECWGIPGYCTVEQDCGNGWDDDLDAAVDCADSDCQGTPACQPGMGYWEIWHRNGTDGEVDLVNTTLTFTVNGSNPQGYDYNVTPSVQAFPDAPGSGDQSQVLAIGDDENLAVTLPFPFPFQSIDYNTIYVVDDGYISFVDEASRFPGPNGWNVYQNPRIAPLWSDLDPGEGGTITYDVFNDRVSITWDGMTIRQDGVNPNSFQLTLFSNGDVQMTWLAVDDVAHLPVWVAGFVTMVGANMGLPPAKSNFRP